jgi:hypothetical protein
VVQEGGATAREGGRFGHLRRLPHSETRRNRLLCTELHDRRSAGGRRKSLQTECLNAAPLSGGWWARLAKPGENRTMQPGCERASRGPRHVTQQLYTSPSPQSSGPSVMPGVSAGPSPVKKTACGSWVMEGVYPLRTGRASGTRSVPLCTLSPVPPAVARGTRISCHCHPPWNVFRPRPLDSLS